jgi:hypothetical protein
MPTVNLTIVKSHLDWTDFRRVGANAIAGGDAEAGGRIGIRPHGRGATQVINIRVTHTARVESDTVKTPALLRHEQGHLDLVIISAHQIKRDIEGGERWQASFRRRMLANATAQVTYDEETEHGTNAAAQARWNLRLEAELASFAPRAASPCALPSTAAGRRDPSSFGFTAGML